MAFKDTLIEFTEQEIAENNIPDDVMDRSSTKFYQQNFDFSPSVFNVNKYTLCYVPSKAVHL